MKESVCCSAKMHRLSAVHMAFKMQSCGLPFHAFSLQLKGVFLKNVGMAKRKKKCVASCWQQLLFAKGCHHLQNLLFVGTFFYLPVLRVAFKISNTEKRSSEFLYFSRLLL